MTDSTETPPTAEVNPESPKKQRKIAIIGSAVSSVNLAPFADFSWEIWGCSPSNKTAPRVDVWFELHNVEVKRREGLVEWMDWLKEQPIVFMQQGPTAEFPNAREYPLEAMLKKYGPFWWTSQVAYMLAAAIDQKPDVIGIYGVDMAANSEYNQQRLACQFFIMVARQQGITVVVPPESDLLEHAPLYGYCESNRHFRKLMARTAELNSRIAEARQKRIALDHEERHLIGALDDLEYNMAHWANRLDFTVI